MECVHCRWNVIGQCDCPGAVKERIRIDELGSLLTQIETLKSEKGDLQNELVEARGRADRAEKRLLELAESRAVILEQRNDIYTGNARLQKELEQANDLLACYGEKV